jgi:hypothetical protein
MPRQQERQGFEEIEGAITKCGWQLEHLRCVQQCGSRRNIKPVGGIEGYDDFLKREYGLP